MADEWDSEKRAIMATDLALWVATLASEQRDRQAYYRLADGLTEEQLEAEQVAWKLLHDYLTKFEFCVETPDGEATEG